GMPMDPLDPYVQLVMGAPPSPDYIPGPEDDADNEDEEESSDSEEEEKEYLAPTVPTPVQYSSVSESDETEPFEEGET
nr:hypothetical protein [Tanacetum cinerariifolium]